MAKFKSDSSAYFFLSTHIIEESAYIYELRYSDIILFMWAHYINTYLVKSPYYNFSKIDAVLTHIRCEIPHGKPTLIALFNKLYDRKIVEKTGVHYTPIIPCPLIASLTQRLRFKVDAIDKATTREGGMPKFDHPKKRFKKRRQGRVKGWRKKKPNKIIYTCRVPFKSKTDKLFK